MNWAPEGRAAQNILRELCKTLCGMRQEVPAPASRTATELGISAATSSLLPSAEEMGPWFGLRGFEHSFGSLVMWNLSHFHCDRRELSGSFVSDCKQVVGRVFFYS